MGYTKQLFEVNQVLTAEELNLMDNQIYANDIAIESLKTSKQDKLDSTNIKTINGESILGQGNIIIEGGNGTVTAITLNGNTFNPSDGVVDLGEIDSVEFAASAKKVENKLTINVDGKTIEFDGSSSKTININTINNTVNLQELIPSGKGLTIRLMNENEEIDINRYLKYSNSGIFYTSILPTSLMVDFSNSGLILSSVKSCTIDAWNVTAIPGSNVLNISVKNTANNTKLFGSADIILLVSTDDSTVKLARLPLQIFKADV